LTATNLTRRASLDMAATWWVACSHPKRRRWAPTAGAREGHGHWRTVTRNSEKSSNSVIRSAGHQNKQMEAGG
jgi:hypothetical protein